jgi:hypothetical protein
MSRFCLVEFVGGVALVQHFGRAACAARQKKPARRRLICANILTSFMHPLGFVLFYWVEKNTSIDPSKVNIEIQLP